jgi:hypothetical protein
MRGLSDRPRAPSAVNKKICENGSERRRGVVGGRAVSHAPQRVVEDDFIEEYIEVF